MSQTRGIIQGSGIGDRRVGDSWMTCLKQTANDSGEPKAAKPKRRTPKRGEVASPRPAHPDDRVRGAAVLEDRRAGRCGDGAAQGARPARARRDADHAALPRRAGRTGGRHGVGSKWPATGFTRGCSSSAIGPGARVLLLDCPELYDRDGIYYEARRRLSRQPRSLRVPVGGRDRLRRAASRAASTSSTRTTGRAASRRSMPARLAPWHLRHPRHRADHSQPGLPGHLRQDVGAATWD